MLLNFYIVIIAIAIQSKVCGPYKLENNNPVSFRQNRHETSRFLKDIPHEIRKTRGNAKIFRRRSNKPVKFRHENIDVRMFDNIQEFHSTTYKSTQATTTTEVPKINIDGIKNVLMKIVHELDNLEEIKNRRCDFSTDTTETTETTIPPPKEKATPPCAKSEEEEDHPKGAIAGHQHEESHSILDVFKGKSKGHSGGGGGGNKKAKWGEWTEWSACSVSCGKGREIRWRHCIEDCDDIETEMEEKTCQLPACGPGKLFGVISL